MEEVYKKLVAAKGEKWANELIEKLNKALAKDAKKTANMLEMGVKFL